MDEPQDKNSIFQGLQEFREHLGGELTLMMLQDIGRSFNLHTVNYLYYQNAIGLLASMSEVTCS
jgi:3-dehydroquinate synthase